MRPLHGTGRSLVWNATPTAASAGPHALAIGGMPHTVAAGHIHPAHGQQMIAMSQAHISSYNRAQLKSAKATARPKAPKSFGSLGSDADGGPLQNTLLSSGGQSAVPGGSAIGTTRSPLDQD